MKRMFVIIRSFRSCFDYHKTNIYYSNLENVLDTRGLYGFESFNVDFYQVPYTLLELVNYFGNKVFYSKTEFCFNSNDELISIKNGNSFLPIKSRDKKYSVISQKEINRLMKDNFG